jgi:hypothetical protein
MSLYEDPTSDLVVGQETCTVTKISKMAKGVGRARVYKDFENAFFVILHTSLAFMSIYLNTVARLIQLRDVW